MCLSCVRVPVHKCTGKFQRSLAIRRRSYRHKSRSRWTLLGLLALSQAEMTYAIPSTGYALVNRRSLDGARQVRNVQNAVNQLTTAPSTPGNLTNHAPEGIKTDLSAFPSDNLKRVPEVFIADTDSFELLADTGPNGYIVNANNKHRLKNFKPETGEVKGVNGEPTQYTGSRDLELTLETKCGSQLQVHATGYLIPDCPYNLLPPQILVADLKRRGWRARCYYDDLEHVLEFKDPRESGPPKQIVSTIKRNKLFTVRANQGYTSFFCHAVDSDPEWCSFAGALHVIPTDEDSTDDSPCEQMREPTNQPVSATGKMREPPVPTDPMRESTDEPAIYVDPPDLDPESDEPLDTEPRTVEFVTKGVQLDADDPSMIKLFRSAVQDCNQTLSFCGPNVRHQNGKAENRIKDLTLHARTALLHAAHRWPEAINVHLWPAALKHYTNVRNAMPTNFKKGSRVNGKQQPDLYDGSPTSRFSGTEIESNLDHFHPFGCPVYVLQDALQAQRSHNKWSDRSRVGIFLCHSPDHATSVPLVLNTQSGNVSSQFYCVYDDEFATCKRDAKFKSLWRMKAKLMPNPIQNSLERIDAPTTSQTPPTPPLPNQDRPFSTDQATPYGMVTKEQIADIFTKPLPRDQFIKLRNKLMSWSFISNREGVRE